MAGRGRPPKTERSRERDTAARRAEMLQLGADGELRGPDLPDWMEWPAATRDFWRIWRESAQSKLFTATDWAFLLDTALLHALFWGGNAGLAGELRLRVAKFGATPEDRMRLKVTVEAPAAEAAPRVLRDGSQERRARLLKAVSEGA